MQNLPACLPACQVSCCNAASPVPACLRACVPACLRACVLACPDRGGREGLGLGVSATAASENNFSKFFISAS